MKLPALSVHSVLYKTSLPNHGIYDVNYQGLANTSKGQSPYSVFGYPLAKGDHPIQLQVRSKVNLQKYPKVFAKLRGNDDPDNKNWKTYEDILNAISENSKGNLSPDHSDSISSESDSSLEKNSTEEVSNCQSILRQELSYPTSGHQLYLDKLKAIHLHVLASEQWNASRLKTCHRSYLVSAANLIHYLSLHRLDIQKLNEGLSSIGLLNLECANAHVLPSITSAIQLLENQTPNSLDSGHDLWPKPVRDYASAQDNKMDTEFSVHNMRKRASMHATALLGPLQDKKDVHIMVTVGREVIANEMLLTDLLKAGANILRINCAHDDPSVWSEIIKLAKYSSQMLEKPCQILMDLAGPKLRTGSLKRGPNVIKISPKKDAKGDVIFPAQVWLSCTGCSPPPHLSPDSVLYVEDEQFINELEVGNIVRFVDVRGRRRSLTLCEKHFVFNGCGFMAECSRTTYVGSGTRLYVARKKGRHSKGRVVDVPAAEPFIRLRVGDQLTIYRNPSLSMEELQGNSLGAPKITCDSGRLFDSVKPGDPIAFDDGKIWGVIQGTSINEIVVSITHASPKGSKLGSAKSINIPKSEMQFEGLTSKDLLDLEFVSANADMVGISFIRDVQDLVIVMQELEKRRLRKLGVVLKIETCGAFEKLPLLLLQAMQSSNPFGVMIARGDLAVECGWDQMASIQEEILSICNASHVPVIWATQVLETLVKSGIPTRAEITDVAHGMRANCIMLNKGKYIVDAVSSLDSILRSCSTEKNMKTLVKPLFPSDC